MDEWTHLKYSTRTFANFPCTYDVNNKTCEKKNPNRIVYAGKRILLNSYKALSKRMKYINLQRRNHVEN